MGGAEDMCVAAEIGGAAGMYSSAEMGGAAEMCGCVVQQIWVVQQRCVDGWCSRDGG